MYASSPWPCAEGIRKVPHDSTELPLAWHIHTPQPRLRGIQAQAGARHADSVLLLSGLLLHQHSEGSQGAESPQVDEHCLTLQRHQHNQGKSLLVTLKSANCSELLHYWLLDCCFT